MCVGGGYDHNGATERVSWGDETVLYPDCHSGFRVYICGKIHRTLYPKRQFYYMIIERKIKVLKES